MIKKGWLIFRNKIVLILLILAGLITISTSSAFAFTLYPTADAPTYQAYPNSNWNNQSNSDVLWTGNWWGSNNSRSYLNFDVSSVDDVSSVKLFLYNLTASPSGASDYASAIVNSYLVTGPWTENGINWSNQPGLGLLGGSAAVSTGNTWYSWDVTNLANLSEGNSFSLALASEGAGHVYGGKDNRCGFSPYLEINTTPEPASLSLLGLGLLGLLGFRKKIS